MNPDYIPAWLKNDSAEYAAKATARLGISPPIKIEWHEDSPDGHKWIGWVFWPDDPKYNDTVINLNLSVCKDLPTREVAWNVAHESRHIWQNLSGRHTGPDDKERDADEFAYDFTEGYIPTKSPPYWNRR